MFPLIQAFKLFNINYDVFSYSNSKLINKDISTLTNMEKLGVNIKDISKANLDNYDYCYIPKLKENWLINSQICDFISQLKNKGIKVYNGNLEDDGGQDELPLYNDALSKLTNNFSNLANQITENRNYLHTICKPIFFIAQAQEFLDTEYLVLLTKKILEEEGFKVVTISGRKHLRLFNCLNYPEDFLSNSLSFSEKVLRLNHFIKAIEIKEIPDVFVLEVPGTVLRYSKYDLNFPEYPYIFREALNCNFIMLNLSVKYATTDQIEHILILCKNIFGYDIDLLNISNNITVFEQERKKTTYLYSENVKKILLNLNNNSNIPIIQAFAPESKATILNNIYK